jgi:hypothetical protein
MVEHAPLLGSEWGAERIDGMPQWHGGWLRRGRTARLEKESMSLSRLWKRERGWLV